MPFAHHLWVLTDHTCTRHTDPGQVFLGPSCSTPAWRIEAGRSGMCSEDKSAIGQPPKAQVLSLSRSFPSSPPIPLHGLKSPPPLLQPLKDLLIHSIQNLSVHLLSGVPADPLTSFLLRVLPTSGPPNPPHSPLLPHSSSMSRATSHLLRCFESPAWALTFLQACFRAQ